MTEDPAKQSLGSHKSNARWLICAAVTTFIVVLPVFSVFYLAFFPEENIWPHLFNTVLPYYVQNTLILMAGVGVSSTLIGVGAAWLTSNCEFRGRKILSWLLLLPFAVPAYVIAYAYTDLLEYAGPIQTGLRNLFGWTSPHDYRFPEIRSMAGAITVMSLVLYPYVYMLARTAFLDQSPTLFITSRSLGRTPWQSFYLISLPVIRPAIVVGLSLVLMETLNDFGTVDYFAVRTLTAGLYDTWLNLGNVGGAAQIACVMLIFVIALVFSERYSRRKIKLYQNQTGNHNKKRIVLTGIKGFLATAGCLLPVLLGFCVPAGLLTYYAIVYFDISWNNRFLDYSMNSLTLSVSAALVTILIGLLLSYTNRLIKSGPTRVFLRLSTLGYAMPGAVLAIGVIIPLAAFDNAVDALAQQWFHTSIGLLLSGTVFALIFAYSIRFLAISSGAIESSLEKVTPNMDLAARSLGKRPFDILKTVHIPIISRGILTAALVVFVDCMKELPTTLILRPFNFETLATHVYQFASDELLEESALSALLIVAVGIIPVIILSKTIDNHQHQPPDRAMEG
ncbi:MAG: iron ABC transporter permease [Proteobacteria bacterium]|nr:MAG: iron ABC transporter permease [Pseudomonadota bacterium]